jgi:hypothetical protein
MTEHIVHRVLGAVRFIDAAVSFIDGVTTQAVVTDPIAVSASGLTFVRNHRHYYVIYRSTHPELRVHHDQFDAPPSVPPVGSVTFTLRADPLTRMYLSRQAAFALPRDPDPDADDSLFTPIDVGLYPAPTGTLFPGWGSLRVTVTDAGGDPVPGALVRVVERADPANVMGRGISDWRGRARGEALVPVADIPTLAVPANGNGNGNGNGPILSQSVAVNVQAFHDPAFDSETALPDPDDLEARREFLAHSAVVELSIAAGQMLTLGISIT